MYPEALARAIIEAYTGTANCKKREGVEDDVALKFYVPTIERDLETISSSSSRSQETEGSLNNMSTDMLNESFNNGPSAPGDTG